MLRWFGRVADSEPNQPHTTRAEPRLQLDSVPAIPEHVEPVDATSDSELCSSFLGGPPTNGASVGNGRLQRTLNWDEATYLRVKNLLIDEGQIRVGRGRGGTVSLLVQSEIAQEGSEAPGPPNGQRTRELDLYPGFQDALGRWAKDQGWDEHFVQQTAHKGSRKTGGTWTRPDFVVVGYRNFEYTPGIVRDLETFEVKPSDFGVEAVFETAAHSRFATRSYLAVEKRDDQDPELLDRVESECQRFGIGFVMFAAAGKLDTWEFRVEPKREEPDPADLERFIQDQIEAKDQRRIRKWIK